MLKAKGDIIEVRENGTIVIKAAKRGKDTFIQKPPGAVVWDRKNKRRIGSEGEVIVRLYERVKLYKKYYVVSEIGENQVVLKRV